MKKGSKHSAITRQKMSAAAKRRAPSFLGKHHTLETKAKLRKARLLQKDPRLGTKHSINTRIKFSLLRKGNHYSPATEFKKGQKPWNAGLLYATKFKPGNYSAVHKWLRNHFGPADRCENLKCEKWCTLYQWAKLRNVIYAPIREYFIRLCQSCHERYDRNQTYELLL